MTGRLRIQIEFTEEETEMVRALGEELSMAPAQAVHYAALLLAKKTTKIPLPSSFPGRVDTLLGKVRRLHKAGLTDGEIAATLNVNLGTIGHKRRALRLPPNRAKRRAPDPSGTTTNTEGDTRE